MLRLRGELARSPSGTTGTSQVFKVSPITKHFDNMQFLNYFMVKGRSYDPVSCGFISRGPPRAVHLGKGFRPLNELESFAWL